MFVGSARPFFFAALLGLGLATVSAPVRGEEPRLAISGYDPVAYFTEGHPIAGKPEFSFEWRHSRWLFASAEHRAAPVISDRRRQLLT